MTGKKRSWMGLVLTVLFLSVLTLAGCTKKASLKNEIGAGREQKSLTQPAAAEKAATADRRAGKTIMREQTLRDQRIGEQTLGDQRTATETKASETIKKQEASGNKEAVVQELQIPDITFAFDEYRIEPENQAILKAAAQAHLKYTNYMILIEGHCDERGSVEYNLALGQKRADEAAKFLINMGIAKERIKTISYGKERPLDPGHDEEALAKNRRDHFVVSPIAK